jgi:hypothetical protein
MFHLVQQSVERYLREHDRSDVTTDHVICLDVTNRRIDGYCYLFGSAGQFPQLVAKVARTVEGRAVLEIEFENLRTLQRVGLNKDQVRTPEPLDLRVEDDTLIALQSALPGTLMKNLRGSKLFSTSRVESVFAQVIDWWTRFVRGFGTSRITLSDKVYEREVLAQVTRFRNSYLLERDQQDLLTRRFEREHPLLSLELPFMARHGDFCTANITLQETGVAVLDWEFPLTQRMPLFDLLYFFASTRYPFGGLRGQSGHFDSLVEVYWGESYFSQAVRRQLLAACAEFDLPPRILPDLLLLSLIEVANMKYEALVTSHEFDYEDLSDEMATDAEKRRRWDSFRDTDRDEPLARIQDGKLPVLDQFLRRGFPEFR